MREYALGRAGNKRMSVMRSMPADGTFAARPERWLRHVPFSQRHLRL